MVRAHNGRCVTVETARQHPDDRLNSVAVAGVVGSMTRKIQLSFLAVLVAIGVVVPSTAQAVTRTYKNLATGFCLDSNKKGQAYTHGCNGGGFQKWNVAGTSVVTFKNVATGLCLDSNTRRLVYTKGCNGGSFQKWRVTYAGGNRVFKNLATSFCLDSNTKRRLYTHGCNGGSFQKWHH
jgi:hypothetical protein